MSFSMKKFFREDIKWNVVFLFTVVFTVFFITIFPSDLQKLLYDLSFTLIFLVGYINSNRKHPMFLPLAISAVILLWISAYFRLQLLFAFSYSMNILFFGYVTFYLVKHLATSKTVTPRIILESIISYLLIGLIFSMIISLIFHFDPAAFSFPGSGAALPGTHLDDFIYFTFVTLSTTGYGDIIPAQPYSRSLTILIAITGQMYLAIIIATLVGKYIASRPQDRNEE